MPIPLHTHSSTRLVHVCRARVRNIMLAKMRNDRRQLSLRLKGEQPDLPFVKLELYSATLTDSKQEVKNQVLLQVGDGTSNVDPMYTGLP